MKRFKLIKESLNGEYWIDEYGSVTYADGDVGDYGHEAIAIQHVLGLVADAFGVDRGDFDDWDEVSENIIKEIIEDESTDEDSSYDLEEEAENDPNLFILKRLLRDGVENAKEMISVLSGRLDGRLFAVQRLNWKRVIGNDVQSGTLLPQDLKAIANGLWEIMDSEGIPENQMDSEEFWLSTYNGPQYDVTYAQIRSGNITGKSPETMQQKAISQAADAQVRDMTIQSMNPAYHPKGINPYGRSINPIGDSVQPYGITFLEFLSK